VRDDATATQKQGNSSTVSNETAAVHLDDKDDINDFFDEFEKTTRGENFRRDGAD
jgi:hypothetical protein